MEQNTTKDYSYFQVEESKLSLIIHPKDSSFQQDFEKELIFLITTIYFGVKANIILDMQNIKYLSLSSIVFFANLARELELRNRKLSLLNSPPSLQVYFHKHQLDRIIQLV
ncbi:MAG: STAS domain-containing protein [Leptospiraceae bacterium]|nr:STAS domain-containing protein [Leptospiraceae bacterium]